MNQIDLTEKEQQIAQLLINYMRNNPDAKHTAEGIARWWVLQQKLEDEISLVERVIDYFTTIGILEKVLLGDGNSFYKLQQEKLEGISDAH